MIDHSIDRGTNALAALSISLSPLHSDRQHVGVEPIRCGWPTASVPHIQPIPLDVPSVCPSPRRARLTQSALGPKRPQSERPAEARTAMAASGYRSRVCPIVNDHPDFLSCPQHGRGDDDLLVGLVACPLRGRRANPNGCQGWAVSACTTPSCNRSTAGVAPNHSLLSVNLPWRQAEPGANFHSGVPWGGTARKAIRGAARALAS
jgi:hypothetical protein